LTRINLALAAGAPRRAGSWAATSNGSMTRPKVRCPSDSAS